MVTSFHDLRSMITKVCDANSGAKDYAEKHEFTVKTHILNNMFVQKGLDYRVIAGATNLQSYVPFITDIHTIMDYVSSEEEMKDILDGYTQIAIFSLFSIRNKNGEIVFEEDEEHPYTDSELFALCNNKKKMDTELMINICKQIPIYRVLVARKFNPKTDSFSYEIYFRSNKLMSAFFRSEIDKQKNAKGDGEKLTGGDDDTNLPESEEEETEE